MFSLLLGWATGLIHASMEHVDWVKLGLGDTDGLFD